MERRTLTAGPGGVVRCPVCSRKVTIPTLMEGEDATEERLPLHGRRPGGESCPSSGMWVDEALDIAHDLDRDPGLPLRAHP